MSFGENKFHPLEIENARDSQFRASELQRELGNDLAKAHKELAKAEYLYRRALTERIKQLHVGEGEEKGMAITMCETVAKGEESIALLRRERDDRKGDLAQLEQEGFRMGADRRAIDGLIDWSMKRDLRVDAEPPDWSKQETHGSGIRSAA